MPSPVPTPTPGPQPDSVKNVFEAFDGDAVNDPGVAGEDWNTINPNTNPGTPPNGGVNNDPPFGSAIVRTFVYDPAVASDFIYTGGSSKDFNDVSVWNNVMKGTGPDKDDVEHAYAAKYIDSITGNTVLVFGGDRPTSNGDANIGFWFFQNPVFVGPNGTFVDANGALATHAVGDVFVLSAFTGGGGTSTIRILKWTGGDASLCTAPGAFLDPAGNNELCDITGTAAAVGSGATNGPICATPGSTCPSRNNPDLGISVVWPYDNKDNKSTCPGGGTLCQIPSPDFFEGGIDLTALGLQTECFASFLLETRSSASVSAVLKDFALGTFESCHGECNKTANPTTLCETDLVNHTANVTITYETDNTGNATLTQTLRDDNGTASTSDDQYLSGLSDAATPPACTVTTSAVNVVVTAGQSLRCTRTVTVPVGTTTDILHVLTVNPPGGVPECTHSATVTVFARPTVSVSVLTCPFGAQTSFDLTATAGGGTPPYRISFNTGEACGGLNEPACIGGNTLSITKSVGGSYTATVTDASGQSSCVATATRNVGYCSDTGP